MGVWRWCLPATALSRSAAVATRLSHGGEDGGFCEAKLCPSERHAMDGVAGAQLQGWVVLQISCKALELNATRWIWLLYAGVALRDSA
ncbi:permease of the major facilitator superfamily [Glaciecola sp. 4H-3-7+YE-5]|jgi:hypothetical protein|nr:permease of the major facilitator superfamily [Glaciecola sp. 4H-3-7+YE-5]